MKKNKGKKIAIISCIGVLLIAAVVVLTIFLSSGGYRVIKVASFDGEVSLLRNSGNKEMIEGMNLKSKDTVTTGNNGLVELLADSDKHIVAQENTSFEIIASGDEKKGKLKINLKYGTSLFEIENKLTEGSSFVVNTPNASMSVRGTTFEVSYSEEDKSTQVQVTSGAVEVVTDKETKMINKGQSATVFEEEIVVTSAAFPYTEDIAFTASDLKNNRYYGVHVKELVGWEYERSQADEIDIDEFVKDTLRIRYFIESKAEIDENMAYLESAGFLRSKDYLTNNDGDVILVVISGYDLPEGGAALSYRFYKKLIDDNYLFLNVFSLEDLTLVSSMDIMTFLPLTNNCYYLFGAIDPVLPDIEQDTEPDASQNTSPDDGTDGSKDTETDETTDGEQENETEEDVDERILISATDLPLLLKNSITYREFEFLLRVFEAGRLIDNFKIVEGGLSIIRHEPVLEGVYAPIDGTELSYDVDKLNRLFSLWTSILITEDKVPQNTTVNGNMITLEPATDIDYGAISVEIYNMCFTEDDMILVEYYYTVNDDSSGNSGVKGDVCVYFMPDGNGRYIFDHAMQYGNERF